MAIHPVSMLSRINRRKEFQLGCNLAQPLQNAFHETSSACSLSGNPDALFSGQQRYDVASCGESLIVRKLSCRPKCLTPHSRKRTGYFSPNRPTWKVKMKIRRMKRKMRETVKSARWRVEENQDAQPHGTWMTRCAPHLEPMSRAT